MILRRKISNGSVYQTVYNGILCQSKAKFRFLVSLALFYLANSKNKINQLHQQVKIEYWLYLSEPKIINDITGDGEI